MTREHALRDTVEAMLERLPRSHVAHEFAPLSWNIVETEPVPGLLSIGWDLTVDMAKGHVQLTHSNDWRMEPVFGDLEPVTTTPGDAISIPAEGVQASYLPLSALEDEGALLAFVLDVVRNFPPNTDCPT